MSINWPFRLIQILAEKEAAAAGFSAIEPEHMIMGVTKFAGLPEPLLRLMASGAAEIQPLIEDQRKIRDAIIGMGKRPSELRRGLRADMGRGAAAAGEGRPLLSPAALKLIKDAWHHAQARGLQDPMGVDLLEAARRQPPTPLLKAHLKSIDENTEGPSPSGMEGSPPSEDPGPIDLARLTNRLKQLRGQLLETILGQDHAIHAFVEGIFNAEVTASADAKRKRPKGIFVFAGPPGVGKTFLAETGAEILGKPFLRLDMSGYGDAMGVVQLVGAQRSYRGAKPGKLTQFVQDNPHAMLLFDEIEKASLDVIHLFLQILDNGSLEDKFTEANVNFRDTLIIFTTNAGRMLYADGAATGAVLHRRTILSALEQEMDPRTHKPFFPQAICSRMATGYPVMFNRLGVGELVQIAEKEMQRVGALFEQAHGKRFDIDPAVPLCLVLREGARTDARTVRSQAEIFCKNAFFNLLRHMSTDHLQTVLDNAKLVRFCVENPHDGQFDKALADVMQPPGRAKLLLAARSQVLAAAAGIDGIEIAFANDMDAAKTLIATDEFDLALVDPWIESLEPAHVPSGTDMDAYLGLTVAGFDKAPIGARLLRRGIELLRCLNESPESPPAFMLNLVAPTASSVDDELLMSAARYGVRGAIDLTCKIDGLSFEDGVRFDADDIAAFEQRLHQRVLRIRRERGVAGIVGQGKALAFDTVPAVVANGAEMLIRLRGLRVVNSPAADDVGGLISDAERPAMGFDDVFGADQAKLELRHIVDC
ncbi:AAA family ATPase [Desulfosarcina cetonica]|uniref:AAA family ATPase n=1 Tax=Desulfosarcina cetonica TaxID=90730 RepID=UPI0006D2BE40|nr:AAA family ATPase [Desulfosarcina cetonica]